MNILCRVAILLCVLMVVSVPASTATAQVPIETDAIIGDFQDPSAVIRDLVRLVHRKGWRCDTVSMARMKLTLFGDPGFKLACNGFRYEYEIVDKAGIWTACIKECKF